MKNTIFIFLGICSICMAFSQEVIALPHSAPSGITWVGGEKEYYSDIWDTQVVTNVSTPSMQVFRPEPGSANGTAVIVAPGGGLFGLSIASEGTDVARWLNEKGITAFVLKYRLVPTGEDGVKEISESGDKPEELQKRVAPVLPLSVRDGLEAIAYVRQHTGEYGIQADKIGFMGFSAGGAVTMGVTFNYDSANRPDFIVPVYPWMTVLGSYEVPEDAPPMLVICASDDPIRLAEPSAELYQKWLKSEKSAGLHMYSKGGHGFGMKDQGLPSDEWIARFYEWAIAEGLTKGSQ
jgi:acetyl esterase/lipase